MKCFVKATLLALSILISSLSAGELKTTAKSTPQSNKKEDEQKKKTAEEIRTLLQDAEKNLKDIYTDEKKASLFFAKVSVYISSEMDKDISHEILAFLDKIMKKADLISIRTKAAKTVSLFRDSEAALNVLMYTILKFSKKEIDTEEKKEFLHAMIQGMPECGLFNAKGAYCLKELIMDPRYKSDIMAKGLAVKAMGSIRTPETLVILIDMFPRMQTAEYRDIYIDYLRALHSFTYGQGPREYTRYSEWKKWWAKNKKYLTEKIKGEKQIYEIRKKLNKNGKKEEEQEKKQDNTIHRRDPGSSPGRAPNAEN